MTCKVYSPRVVGEQRPDFHSLESFLADSRFAGKSGEALILSIYDYLTSTVDGVWHFWPVDEREGHPVGVGDECDPLKFLNVYGWMICGQNAMMLQGLYQAAGFPARLRGLPGHVVCEVFFDERWHILDVDMWTWFRTSAGHLAGIDELAQDPQGLILENHQRSDPCNLPDRSLESYARMYEQAAKVGAPPWPTWATRAHTMDFSLRPGETLMRSQDDEGRFHLPHSWQSSINGAHGSEWKGRPIERFEPRRTIGNGRWIYAPDLTSRTRDVEVGAWQQTEITQDGEGLVGPGEIVFRMQSPYPFCGIPDVSQEGNPTRDGVWLTISGQGNVRAGVTDAEGAFVEVLSQKGVFSVKRDITALVTARYDVFVRLTLASHARVNTCTWDGYIMVAPLSLPRLIAGSNRMELRTEDQFGLATQPWLVPVDFRSEEALRRTLVRVENGSFQMSPKARLRMLPATKGAVTALFRFDAPVGRHFAWAYAIATIPEGPVAESEKTMGLAWSRDGETWQEEKELAIPHTEVQWDASLDGLFRPEEPVAYLWLRVTSDTGIAALEFAGHICESAAQSAAKANPVHLSIAHHWTDADGEHTEMAPDGATTYSISCGVDPRHQRITMHVPSVLR